MTATDVLRDLQAKHILLSVEGERLTYDAPAEVMTPDVLNLLRQYKAGLLALLEPPRASVASIDDREQHQHMQRPPLPYHSGQPHCSCGAIDWQPYALTSPACRQCVAAYPAMNHTSH